MRSAAIETIEKHFLLTNYGSFFQHYALRQVLIRLGFVPFRVVPEDEISSPWEMCVEQIKDWIRPLYWAVMRLPDRNIRVCQMKARDASFWKFLPDYRVLIGRLDEKQLWNDETVGIRGGDQVLYDNACKDWLSLVRSGNPRLTYAVSTDWQWNDGNLAWRSFIREKLARFTAVGIRESAGVRLVKDLAPAGVPVQHVADPVQLLTCEDFRRIQSAKPIFTRPTLLCYLVNIGSEDDVRLSEYERLAELTGCELKFVGIQGGELFIPKRYRALYTPRQFLRALDDATYFVTNSYHGSVLAIAYQKTFLSVWQNCPPGRNQNERQKELMHRFGLGSRWTDYKLSAEEWARLLVLPTDWADVAAEAERWRLFSSAWLKCSLGVE